MFGWHPPGEAGECLAADGLARGKREDRLEDRSQATRSESTQDALPDEVVVPVAPFELATE
jgi:hypothetical protein